MAGPPSNQTFDELLAKIKDENARRYVEVRVHSDLATELYLTNAIYGLENYLTDEPDYMKSYSMSGGLDLLPRALADRIKARVLLNHTVTRVEKGAGSLPRPFAHSQRSMVGRLRFRRDSTAE